MTTFISWAQNISTDLSHQLWRAGEARRGKKEREPPATVRGRQRKAGPRLSQPGLLPAPWACADSWNDLLSVHFIVQGQESCSGQEATLGLWTSPHPVSRWSSLLIHSLTSHTHFSGNLCCVPTDGSRIRQVGRAKEAGVTGTNPEPEERAAAPAPKAGQNPYVHHLRTPVSNLLYFFFGYKEITKTPVPSSQPVPCYSSHSACISNSLPVRADLSPVQPMKSESAFS